MSSNMNPWLGQMEFQILHGIVLKGLVDSGLDPGRSGKGRGDESTKTFEEEKGGVK